MQGFDEYMNLVLDEAEEVSIKKKTRKPLGELLATLLQDSFHISYIGFVFGANSRKYWIFRSDFA